MAGGQQSLQGARLSFRDDDLRGGQQPGNGKLQHHARRGMRHGTVAIFGRLQSLACRLLDGNGRFVPGGESLLKGVVEINFLQSGIFNDSRRADRAIQPAGDR